MMPTIACSPGNLGELGQSHALTRRQIEAHLTERFVGLSRSQIKVIANNHRTITAAEARACEVIGLADPVGLWNPLTYTDTTGDRASNNVVNARLRRSA